MRDDLTNMRYRITVPRSHAGFWVAVMLGLVIFWVGSVTVVGWMLR